MRKSMFGLANNPMHAQQILWNLLVAGFGFSDVSVLMEESLNGLNGNINLVVKSLFNTQLSTRLLKQFLLSIKQGKSVIVVNVEDPLRETKAKDIFAKEGTKDIITLSENSNRSHI